MALGKVPGLDFLFFKMDVIVVLLFQMAVSGRMTVRYLTHKKIDVLTIHYHHYRDNTLSLFSRVWKGL